MKSSAVIAKEAWGSYRPVLLFVLYFLWHGEKYAAAFTVPSIVGDDPSYSQSEHGELRLQPTVEYLGPYDTPTLSQMPPTPIKKVLFLAIGSGVVPWDFWDKSPSCPLCRGLPESRKIVLDALNRSYAVLLISPLDVGHAWHAWPPNSTDLANAMSILGSWKHRHGLSDTPTVALGISAGGHALSVLGLKTPPQFSSMVLMVSKGLREAWNLVRTHYPPTLFVHCPKDRITAENIRRLVAELRGRGLQADEVKWFEHPVSPTWFSDLIPRLSEHTSRGIYEAFRANGSILKKDDYLVDKYPDETWDWQAIVRAQSILPEDPEAPGQLLCEAAIEQELRVANAMHVTLSRRNEEIFAWFERHHDYSNFKSRLHNVK